MQDRRRATWVAVFLAAFATAHLMQYGLTVGRTFPGFGPPEVSAIAPALPASREAGMLARVVVAGPGLPPAPPLPDRLGPERTGVFGLPCDRSLETTVEPGALIRLRLTAPCDAGVRVEIAHAGLRFALRTSGLGVAEATVPALVPEAVVTASLDDGTVLSARAEVPEARGLFRVAVSAPGRAAVSLLPPGNGAEAVLRLGDPGMLAPLLAEVYLAPGGARRYVAAAPPRIVAEVTEANCSEDLRVEVARTARGAMPDRSIVEFGMPDCGAVGSLLLLPVPEDGDLRLARN